jgi:hypothetical protein
VNVTMPSRSESPIASVGLPPVRVPPIDVPGVIRPMLLASLILYSLAFGVRVHVRKVLLLSSRLGSKHGDPTLAEFAREPQDKVMRKLLTIVPAVVVTATMVGYVKLPTHENHHAGDQRQDGHQRKR